MKLIVKLHRIFGSILSIVFFIWFASGIVMIFAGFPRAPKKGLFMERECLSVKDSIKDFPLKKWSNAKGIVLKKVGDVPCYYFKENSKRIILNAKTLEEINSFSEASFDKRIMLSNKCKFTSKIINDYDQWIPWERYKMYFPIKKYYLDDDEASVIYASLKTGEIVQKTSRKSRWLARIGAIPHWFYFKYLRLNAKAWSNTVLWFSGIGAIMCLAGIILGFYRMRRRKRDKKRGLLNFSPYKKRWYKWHHILGFFFGFTCFTFVFSGMMSLTNVPNWIMNVDNSVNYKAKWSSKFKVDDYKLPISSIINTNSESIKEIRWDVAYSKPSYFLYSNEYYFPKYYDASRVDSLIEIKTNRNFIENRLYSIFKDKIKNIDIFHTPDDYYGRRPSAQLPFLRIEFNDENETFMYIGVESGKCISLNNKSKRLRRWLYKGLHTLNFKFLREHDWIRKFILLFLCVGGLFVSYTGIILSVKYIRRIF
ncbi:MAG: PepSY domain-containing protein [Marinifilaceae bacterium]|jgi:hypothetical protein|nr:PepSY domain-containing protein [Marinifilaceae bacterium]